MSFSRALPPLQLLFTLAVTMVLSGSLHALDSIREVNGQVQQGQITRVAKGAVVIKIGAGEIGIPFAQIAQINMTEPAVAVQGLQLQEAGKNSEALALIKPLVDQFGGLPLEWAEQATAALGDLYLSTNQIPQATAAYQNFKKLYPGAGLSLTADVGMARIAAASNQTDEARKTLEPIVASALAKPDFTKAESAAFGQACFTLGNISEKEGKFADALQNYLRTVTIFYADRATTSRAQERADAIRKEHAEISVP